jgi:hypothetical protein
MLWLPLSRVLSPLSFRGTFYNTFDIRSHSVPERWDNSPTYGGDIPKAFPTIKAIDLIDVDDGVR